MTEAGPYRRRMQTPRLFLAPALTDETLPLAQRVEALLDFHRRVFGDARMDAGDGDSGDGDGDGDEGESGDGETGKAEKKFTQADLERIASKEKDQGKRAGATEAHKALMKTLGLPETTKPEDVKAALDKGRAAELAAMNDADRAKAEAEQARKAAEAEKAAAAKDREEAAKERHDVKVAGLLERAGVGVGEEFEKDPAKRDRAIERATKLLDGEIEVGADSDDIRKAIATLKKDMPSLFGKAQAGPPADGRPAGAPPGQRAKGQTAKEAAHAIAVKKGWVKEKAAS